MREGGSRERSEGGREGIGEGERREEEGERLKRHFNLYRRSKTDGERESEGIAVF